MHGDSGTTVSSSVVVLNLFPPTEVTGHAHFTEEVVLANERVTGYETVHEQPKPEMSKRPLLGTHQPKRLQDFSDLGYSLSANEHLELDLSFTKLNKTIHSPISHELYSAPGILLPLVNRATLGVLPS